MKAAQSGHWHRSRERQQGERGMREMILEAARTRFQRFGPRKTTMEEIAREAGCSRATVYAHFPGKEELYEFEADVFKLLFTLWY